MEERMKTGLKALVAAATLAFAAQAAAQVTLYKDDGFRGNHVTIDHTVDNFANSGFNDEMSSAEVRGGAWQVCTDAYFGGRCVVLRPGNYPSLGSMGLNDQISSVRPVDEYGRADERYYGPRDRHTDRGYGDSYYGRDDRYYSPRDREPDWRYRGY
jgi:beta/gamma crystallin